MKENKQFFINDTKKLFSNADNRKKCARDKNGKNGPLKIVILNDAEDED